ncbi:energy transducer TonB [bacterium]|nr:energy transducer TonB [bacterium]
MKSEKLLLKTLIISFFIHIAGISVFGIILPKYYSEKKPIEVSLLPPSVAPSEIRLSKVEVTPKMPEIKASGERLAISREQEVIKFSAERFIGSSEYLPITQINPKFELPEQQVHFPIMTELVEGEQVVSTRKTTLEIEGLAGGRQLIYRQEVEYPQWAQREGIEGNIKIKFWVNPEGKITSAGINSSSGHPELDLYITESFRNWLFEPVKTDKQVWGIITFRFRLK